MRRVPSVSYGWVIRAPAAGPASSRLLQASTLNFTPTVAGSSALRRKPHFALHCNPAALPQCNATLSFWPHLPLNLLLAYLDHAETYDVPRPPNLHS